MENMMKDFIRKHWSSLLIFLFIALLFIPQTGMPIKVFLNRLLAFSPSEVSVENQEKLSSYNWKLKDEQGNQVNLSQSKDKVVLVNVWATWCPPCVAEMPSMQNLYNEYGDQIDFYFVASDQEERVTRLFEKESYDLPVYYSSSPAPVELQTKSLPTTFLIGKTGKIVINKKGAASWDSDEVKQLIEKLLK